MILQDFQKMKLEGKKITMLTCYDYTFARILAESQVDTILVGDSLAMVMHGHKSTLKATIELMALHIAAVSAGSGNKFIVGDLPFLSYRKSLSKNMESIEALMKAGAHAVKLEGALGNLDLIRHCVESGVPVMGHLGLTPQMINLLGGHKVQGRKDAEKQVILQHAKDLEAAGCFAIVLECVPTDLACEISKAINIPTIGIGAGAGTDGQVLVLHDMLGLNKEFHPKFLRHFFDGFEKIKDSINQYCNEVQTGTFPNEKESYQ